MAAVRVFISAGEVSGDIAASRLIAEIRRRVPDAQVFGAGGARMAAAGADIAIETNAVGVVGVTETFKALPSVVAAFHRIRRRVRATPPDIAVLVGNDVFNVLLARWLRARGIPTVAYFPPQVWMWRSFARPIARSFDTIITSFPEEQDVYARAHAATAVQFVGHYLADDLQPVTADERTAARRRLQLPEQATIVGILPGSRRDEINALTTPLLDAAGQLLAHARPWRFVIAAADAAVEPALRAAVATHAVAPHASVATDSHAVMRAADLVLVASGTASLEAALLGVPMVITYKVSFISYLIARAAIELGLIHAYVVGLPNLVLGRAVVPEVLQYRATPARVASEAWRLLSSVERLSAMRTALHVVGERLRGPAAIPEAANAVLRGSEGNECRV